MRHYFCFRRDVSSLVVNTRAGSGTSSRKPVDADPRQNLIIRPRIAVGPIMQLLIDPGEEGDRRVCQRVANCLRLRTLQEIVTSGFLRKPLRPLEATFFGIGIWGKRMLQGKQRILLEFGGMGEEEVDMACLAGVGVQNAHGSRHVESPVAALSDVLIISQLQHELVTSFGILLCGKSRLLDAAGKAKVGKRRCDNMEGR